MIRLLLKKQLREIFRNYFYNRKKNKARSKAGTVLFFLAFALLYPDYQILLFFILPVKMKYIALADAALMTYSFIIGTWPMRGCMILSLLPLFLFFGDTMLAEGKRIVRQIRYKLGK